MGAQGRKAGDAIGHQCCENLGKRARVGTIVKFDLDQRIFQQINCHECAAKKNGPEWSGDLMGPA